MTKEERIVNRREAFPQERALHQAHAHGALISRRSLLVALGGIVLSLSFPKTAHAYTRYVTTNMGSIWNPPNYVRLNQNSNLFLPGDIPRSSCRAECTFTNRAISLDTSYSYWGTDLGLTYVNANQIHWPLRNYSYGQDAFSYEAAASGSWGCKTIDSLTNATLENNASGCGVDGYAAHQIVSFSIWNVQGFGGGVLPAQVGTWAMHNASGHIKGTFGYYTGGGNDNGVTPPDWFCSVPGYGANAHITCFSTRALPSGGNYILLYCLYVLIELANESAYWGTNWDNYGGIMWATALAAQLKCNIEVRGLDEVADTLAANLCSLLRCESKFPETKQALQEAVGGGTPLPDALEGSFSDYSPENIFLTAQEAAREVYRALTQKDPSEDDIERIASNIDKEGVGAAIRSELETQESAATLSFPVRIPSITCKVNERDAGNNLRAITTDTSGTGRTGYVFNRGIYTASIQNVPQSWTPSTTNNTVTIPDTGSGQTFSFNFAIEAAQPESVQAEPLIRYFRDYEAMSALGKAALCFSEKGIKGVTYVALDKETAKATRTGCEWDGWYVDSACTTPYTPTALEGDLELYCVNHATVKWAKSERAKDLEADQGSILYLDDNLSEQVIIDDILPDSVNLSWHDTYTPPDLPTLYWRSSGEIRSSEGRCCRDSAGKYVVDAGIAITQSTTLFADWRPATYDGIHAD